MFGKTLRLVVLFVLYNVSNIEGYPEYRPDYTYNEQADGWMKLHLIPATWSDARLRCHAEGAVLASPLTQKIRHAVVDHVWEKSSVRTIFTGVHTTYSKGVYASIEGEPLSKLSIEWAPNEPDNYKNSESCLAMRLSDNGTMWDVRCNDVFPYVCYKKNKPTPPVRRSRCGTYDPEYNIDTRTGSCYKFHRNGLTWPAAYMTCMAEGAHLVIINSDVESQVLKELYAKNPDRKIFAKWPQYASIGTYDAGDGGYWMTIHGETPAEAGFDRWQPGEPNNGTQPRGEFCGVTQRNYIFLHDAPCDWIMPFICEKKPENLEESDEIQY